jgi:hypothetical protein
MMRDIPNPDTEIWPQKKGGGGSTSFYFILFDLFYSSVNISDYVAHNGKLIGE